MSLEGTKIKDTPRDQNPDGTTSRSLFIQYSSCQIETNLARFKPPPPPHILRTYNTNQRLTLPTPRYPFTLHRTAHRHRTVPGIGDVARQADPSYLQVVNELNGEISLDVGDPSEQPELRVIPNPNLFKAKKLLGKIEAALRELPVERPPKTDIYNLDIGIQFQKGSELVWDNVPTEDVPAGGASASAVVPTRQEKAKFLKVLGDVVTLIAISSDRGIFMIGNEGNEQKNIGGGKA